MLQRSTHDAAVDVPDIPATVQPGETIDWPHPIAGFEPVEDTPPEPDPEPDAPAKTPRKRATTADGEESSS